METSYKGNYFKLEEDKTSKYFLMTFNDELVVDLAIASKMKDDRINLLGSEKRLLIIDANGLASIDDDARSYWATKGSFEGIKAVAIITKKKWQAMLVNFFIQFNKPPAPTRLFTDMEQAKKWIVKFD